MAEPLPGSELASDALARIAGQIARLEQIAEGWDEPCAPAPLSAVESTSI